MLSNRSVPPCTVIPVLSYPDVGVAADWLCQAFGFKIRLRIGNHRIQMKVGDGCFVIAEGNVPVDHAHSVLVRVVDAESHCERARQHGARILAVPTDFPFGERQYSALDFAGHRWTFTQSIADVAPETWGGESVDLWWAAKGGCPTPPIAERTLLRRNSEDNCPSTSDPIPHKISAH